MLVWLLASLHILAFGIGLGAVYARARLLRGPLDPERLSRVFFADNLWGLAAFLWLATGIPRAFTGLEKGADYYLHTPWFHAKLTLFLIVLLLEIRPMSVLIRWRRSVRRGQPVDTAPARGLARISHAEAGILIIMLFLATAVARGLRPA